MDNLKTFLMYMRQRGFAIILHVVILILSIALIVMISIDTFHNISFNNQPQFQHWQFLICMIFIGIFFIELLLAEHRWKFFLHNFFFLLVSIPYQMIIFHYGIHLSREASYLIRYIPLIRGGYALALVVGWFTSNKATSLFFSYLITLFSLVYFASLTFYLFEYKVNPLVKGYTDALWWAAMDVTTVGCNIVAVTGVGRALSVLLAACGMMMFPIFTVYVTNLMTQRNKDAKNKNIFTSYDSYLSRHDDKEASATVGTEATLQDDAETETGPATKR